MSCKDCTCDVLEPRKTIFMDIDDVILNYLLAFSTWIKENHNIKINKNHLPETWGYTNYIGDQDHLFSEFSTKFNKKLDIIPGAIEFINNAKKIGWEVVLITNHPNCFTIGRIKLLKKYGLHFDNYYSCGYHTPEGKSGKYKKADFLKLLGYKNKDHINVLIDDKFSHVEDFVSAGLGYGVTMDRPYNQEDIKNSQPNSLITIVRPFVDPFAQNRAAFKETLKLLEKLS